MFLAEFVELVFGFVGALQAPEEGGELVEEVELEGVLGVEGFFEFFDEDVVGGGAFGFEAWGLGAEAVFEGVLGGVFFAVGSARAGRFFGVAAVGGEFAGGDTVFMRAGWAPGGFEAGFGSCGGAFFD